MIRSKTRWTVASLDAEGEANAASLASALSLSPLVAKLLVQRGFDHVEAAARFLSGGLECLHDPFLLKGMSEAVDRIRLAIDRGERVRIYGDYDADGVSSTTLMTYLFQRLEMSFDSYIPHRTLEGYGLNNKAIELASELGVTLIVTVDTGISAVEQVAYAASLGIDVIVTDHHEPPHDLPAALAIVNPKQEDCPYPFKGLAGVGVAFKLAQALLGEPPIEWTDVVALGTIADLMPLLDENRVLVRLGLEQLRNSEKPGFQALAEIAGVELSTITATDVAFGMAPRINAAGRLRHAGQAVHLLTANDRETAGAAALILDQLNKERQLLVETIVNEAQAQWLEKCERAAKNGRPEPSVIVLAADSWNPGVVGIVASKFVEKQYKPTLVLGIHPDSGMCKGSARSIAGFDLHAALTECEELLDHYGGHQAAAGMSLHRDKLDLFEERLSKLADEWLQEEDWIAKTSIDLACKLEDATLNVREQLALLEPFGMGNAAPKLLLQGAVVADQRTMGKENKHLKLSLSEDGRLLDAVGFGLGMLSDRISGGAAIELVGELTINEWNGQRKAQFLMQDIRVAHVQLFDHRYGAGSDYIASLHKLIQNAKLTVGTVLVPLAVLQEALSFQQEFSLPEQLRICTYETFIGEPSNCPNLILFGRPPSASVLIEAIHAAVELEVVYVLYEDQRITTDAGRRSGAPARPKKGKEQPVVLTEEPSFPTREKFGQLYQTLRRVCPIAVDGHKERLATMMAWPIEQISFILGVFHELELVITQENQLQLVLAPVKRELSDSVLYREEQRLSESEKMLFAETKELSAWIARL
ncbi:single-stranded-DNA-specific exonuclease RecJ [Paenibacillus baekrokdamisoli]|uniref:Single-stranded-DNA-specific exonuclease RecJ n=1 Tax=Paenibacillus baekrokdamisoli TaxID=1712516 RepID=A0A3G9IM40_9BACL|nr:single-stranded-DNA-specific exonuclease RecJ [Paenibacillus baekrokdamisoli]MBB3067523.1 single-stranded-DNA-specific exonuclease [Paenibacillus baekrokdamisoli]BBH19292.1 single-stranded-DNA-specific exonuclease RecJ [Paenibacillus baekrokdamisoli]